MNRNSNNKEIHSVELTIDTKINIQCKGMSSLEKYR